MPIGIHTFFSKIFIHSFFFHFMLIFRKKELTTKLKGKRRFMW